MNTILKGRNDHACNQNGRYYPKLPSALGPRESGLQFREFSNFHFSGLNYHFWGESRIRNKSVFLDSFKYLEIHHTYDCFYENDRFKSLGLERSVLKNFHGNHRNFCFRNFYSKMVIKARK